MPYTDKADPKRAKLRIDSVEPKQMKSRTDKLDPLRIAVVDPQPLLGPEFRAQLGEMVLDALKDQLKHTDVLEYVQDWTFFGTADLSIDRDRPFDVIVSVGIGSNPEHRVSSLRAALGDAFIG